MRKKFFFGFVGSCLLGLWVWFVYPQAAGGFGAQEKSETDSFQRRQKAELMGFFLKDPQDAQLPTTPMSVELFNQAADYFHGGEYDLARQALRESLDLDDSNAFAYELMGDIDDLQQKLDEARQNYQIAYNLNPTGRLREKIEKLTEEKKIDKKLDSYSEEHFLIKYFNDPNRPVEGFELRELLRQTYRNISTDFAYYFRHQVAVVLYDEQDFKQIAEVPHWVAGLYDGKVRMPINKRGFSEQDLRALTTHEVTHAFVADMSSRRAPPWINEGLAVYEENKIRERDMQVFSAAVRQKNLWSLHELMTDKGPMSLKDRTRITLFYEQSMHLVQYLIDRYKMFKVKEMLQAYGKGKDSEEVVRGVLKISIDRLEKEWLETV